MMSKNREMILNEIAKDSQYKTICKNIVQSQALFDLPTNTQVDNKYLTNELYSEFLLSLCEIDENKLMELYNKDELRFYLVRIIVNQYKSNSSRYYRQIKKKYTKTIDYAIYNELYDDKPTLFTELEQEWLPFIMDEINKIHWYEQTIFKMYINDQLSMKKIADKIGIPESSIKSTINSVKNNIREKIEKERNK